MKAKQIIAIVASVAVLVTSTAISTVIIVKFSKPAPKSAVTQEKSRTVAFQTNHAVALCNDKIKSSYKDNFVNVSFVDLSNRFDSRSNTYLLFAKLTIREEQKFAHLDVACEVSGKSYTITGFKVTPAQLW